MKRILVVEDNENNIYLISYILRKRGYAVLEARSGKEAQELIRTRTFNLILMDIQLPDADGLQLVRNIKKMTPRMDVPIIALTSFAMAGDREKALEAGCSGYIEKPIDPETILVEIEKYL